MDVIQETVASTVKEMFTRSNDGDRARDPPPTWEKKISFKGWKRSVLVWADNGMKPSRKANLLIESLKKNEEKEGLKEMIVEEIIENHDFDYNDRFVVENILVKIEKFMEESLWVRNVKLARELVDFKQKPEENNKQFVIRFSNFENRLKNNGTVLNNFLKAGLIMNQSSLNKTEKANIMSIIDNRHD